MNWQEIVKKYDLDVSVIELSKVIEINRLDAEFYKPEHLMTDKFLKSKEYFMLNKNEVVSGPFGSTLKSEEYIDKGVRLIRVQDIKQRYFLDKESAVYISEESNNKIKNSELKTGDLVVSKVGNTIGLIAHIDEELKRANVSENNIGIKLDSYSEMTRYSILTFLNSKYGQGQILRRISGNAQPKLNVFNFTEIIIPTVSTVLQNEITKIVKSAYQLRIGSEKSYSQAEQLLLTELGLANYVPNEANTSIRYLFECLQDDRFDAEYWMPKYDEIATAIRNYRNGYDTFNNLFVIGSKAGINTESTYRYIELADVNSTLGTIENYTELLGKDLPSRGRMSLKKDDVIMSSLDGSLDKTALITINEQNLLGSTGFFVLRKKYFEPEVALVLLKSRPIQEYIARQAQGTILTAIPKTSLSRIVLPRISNEIQFKVKKLIQEAHSQKEQSKIQLEQAKRAVEIFIEQDEEKALGYLAI